MKKNLLALAVLAASSGVMASDTMIENPRAGVYADTEWATAHGGPRNDDYIAAIKELPRYYEQSAEVLEGAAVLLGPTRGPNGHFYATTGMDKGHSNMTAFDGEGNIIWQTTPWQTASDFDPGGVIAAPAVDKNGGIYISDANQMWAFTPEGDVKWVTELPEPTVGHSEVFDELNLGVKPNSITNPFFTMPVNGDESTAHVGGITIYGDVLIFDRETGELVAGPVNMPGEFTTKLLTPAPGAMSEPFAADGWGEVIWTYFHGGVESANVPAVNPGTGMIYATGTSSKVPGDGAIHGFTFDPETKKIDFVYEAQMGPGSGSSPAISSDYQYIYASDEDAVLYKYPTSDDKEPVWTSNVAGRPASASLGGPGDDKIYVYDERYIYAVDPETGKETWSIDMHDFADQLLPEKVGSTPNLCEYNAFHNGIVVSTDNELVITGVLGYKVGLEGCPEASMSSDTDEGSDLLQTTQIQGVWTVDPDTGEILRDGQMIPAEDTNEAFTVPTTDGYLLMDRGVLNSGVNRAFYPMTEGLFAEGNKPILPQGGVEILQGADDIKITAAISGRVMFDESFAKEDSTLRLEGKSSNGKLELKGDAEGQRDVSYKVNIKSNKNGRDVGGDIEIKKDKKTIHKIQISQARFNDRSVEGFGVDKKTGKKVNFYVADWRSSGEKGDK
ncbi:PQQ-binding-like beta-propeller repeat protein [Endozoicomonas arenosclerae]|uniref:outer membrane protein assembly factor BamB family protein n=1 Tax=Endozoicomonas arenosclerae TaxID=1633495 RepID=UPI000780FA8B|nr:PQQ-binding-like beta-propeller repeat protein [Endozoicomonas arenosclerae]